MIFPCCYVLKGLVHLGKGTLTLGPYHCDRSLMMPVAVGGLLSVLVSFLDVKNGRFVYCCNGCLPFMGGFRGRAEGAAPPPPPSPISFGFILKPL